MAESKSKDPRFPDNALFEVMTDAWGYDPQHVRGDLIRQSDTPYDCGMALSMGTLRLAPEYDGTGMASTTQPLNPDGSIDEVAQANARGEVPSYEAVAAQNAAIRANRAANTAPVAAGGHSVANRETQPVKPTGAG